MNHSLSLEKTSHLQRVMGEKRPGGGHVISRVPASGKSIPAGQRAYRAERRPPSLPSGLPACDSGPRGQSPCHLFLLLRKWVLRGARTRGTVSTNSWEKEQGRAPSPGAGQGLAFYVKLAPGPRVEAREPSSLASQSARCWWSAQAPLCTQSVDVGFGKLGD